MLGATCMCWSPAKVPQPQPPRRRSSPGVAKVLMPRADGCPCWPSPSPRCVVAQWRRAMTHMRRRRPPAAGKNVMPRVAALLDVMQILSDVAARGRSPDTFERPIYAGNAIEPRCSRRTPRRWSPCAPASFDPVAADGGSAGRGGRCRRHRLRAESTFLGAEIVKSRATRTDRGAHRRLRRPRHGSRRRTSRPIIEPLADKLGAADRRIPRRGRCGLCAE
jgi:electron transfer flavoprotein alpha subunit